jgi:predicted NBD/HSP70 family sugar kinase
VIDGAEGRSGSFAVDVLRRVHRRPKVTRADVARELGLGTGSATEVVARLRNQGLLDETPAPPTGSRGRPTTCLGPSPAGPLVLAAAIEHNGWVIALVEVGGRVVRTNRGRHRSHRPEVLLRSLGARIAAAIEDEGHRLRAVGISVAGAVQDERLAQIHDLGWRDVDVRAALSEMARGLPVVVGNDASLGGLAEARRGAGSDASTLLHLRVQAGIGGVVVEHGQPVLGATGAAGEFGHLPFGERNRRCPCGARGCWSPEVDGTALARLLGARVPDDSFAYGQQVMANARGGDPPALAAVRGVAAALGSGIGGLVNALDPDMVTVGGLGIDVLELAPKQLRSAYVSGLMSFRRDAPPPVLASGLGADGPLVGAAEAAFDRVLTEDGLDAWNRRAG